MDAVITYVNGLDPVWQAEYASATGQNPITKRYRDWGTLKYLLRGIETHIPYVNSVFLVVSSESQVPDYIDRNNLHIILHKDIIPEQFLPTFNSSTIEMFLHRIPGLGERFLYFNDDMFPVSDIKEDDFFKGDKIRMGFSRHIIVNNSYKHALFNSDRLVRKHLGKRHFLFFIRPQHTCSPMLKSESEKIFEACREEIFSTITMQRAPFNNSQFVYTDYLYFTGKAINRRVSNRHLSPSVKSAETMCGYILKPKTKLININDITMPEKEFLNYQKKVTDAFASHFPKRSRFER